MLFYKWLPVIVLWAVSPLSTVSAEVYKWVDDDGDVHFGDSLPDEYQQAGKAVDLSGHRPSEAEQRHAEALAESARQAADSARERRLEANANQSGQPPTPKNASTPSPPIKPRPGQARLTGKQRMENYEAELERYRESLRCFGKYQIKGGGTRGYAFNVCETVKKPRHPDVQ